MVVAAATKNRNKEIELSEWQGKAGWGDNGVSGSLLLIVRLTSA